MHTPTIQQYLPKKKTDVTAVPMYDCDLEVLKFSQSVLRAQTLFIHFRGANNYYSDFPVRKVSLPTFEPVCFIIWRSDTTAILISN